MLPFRFGHLQWVQVIPPSTGIRCHNAAISLRTPTMGASHTTQYRYPVPFRFGHLHWAQVVAPTAGIRCHFASDICTGYKSKHPVQVSGAAWLRIPSLGTSRSIQCRYPVLLGGYLHRVQVIEPSAGVRCCLASDTCTGCKL